MGTLWAFVSGKGGVGKSTLALSAGVYLARAGKRVALVDADAGLRNLDMMLGVENKIVFDLTDVIEGSVSLEQATLAIKDYPGLSLLSASQTQEQDAFLCDSFERLMRRLKKTYDFVLIDCPTGIGKIVRDALTVCDEVTVVTMADDIAIRDADHVAGILSRLGHAHPYVVVNRTRPAWVKKGEIYPSKTVAQTLDASLMGEIPEDEEIYRAMLRRVPPVEGEGIGAKALRACASVMLGEKPATNAPDEKAKPFGLLTRFLHGKGMEEKA